MSTTAGTSVPQPPAKVSWLKKFGHVVAKGFTFLVSPAGQKVVAAGEAAVEVAFPVADPIIALANVWYNKAAEVEGKAVAAASIGVNVTGEQKAIAAIEAVTPDVENILAQFKLLPLPPASMKIINDSFIAIANELVPVVNPTPATPKP